MIKTVAVLPVCLWQFAQPVCNLSWSLMQESGVLHKARVVVVYRRFSATTNIEEMAFKLGELWFEVLFVRMLPFCSCWRILCSVQACERFIVGFFGVVCSVVFWSGLRKVN